MPKRSMAVLLAVLLSAGTAFAQPAALSPQAEKIHQQFDKIGALGNVNINMRDGRELYGTIARIGADEFMLQEVDQGRELTLRYCDVRRVRGGYGETRNIRGQRIHPRTKLIVTLAVVGGLLTLVFVAVLSDKS
jgi:hypothetical protein